MQPHPKAPVRSARPPSVLDERLRASRRRWAVAVAGRGLGWGLGLGGGAVLFLALLAAAGGVPDGIRPLARWLPILLAVAPPVLALVRIAVRPPSDRSLALSLDERHPELEFGAITLLDLSSDHPYADRIGSRVGAVLDRAEREAADRGRDLFRERMGSREWVLPLVAMSVAALTVMAVGGPTTIWAEWGRGAGPVDQRGDRPGFVAAPTDADADRDEPIDLLDHLAITVHPPAYSGLPGRTLDAREEIAALAGSRVRLTATLPAASPAPRVRRIGDVESDDGFRPFASTNAPSGLAATPDPESTGNLEWVTELQLDRSDRALVLRDGSEQEWIIPLLVRSDAPPVVELLEPNRDMVLATGSGQVSFRARAHDPFGIDRFELAWVHTRGSGESFDFVDGALEWEEVAGDGEGAIEGRLTLDLDEMSLGSGDVLHFRAIARDGNVVTGPGEGVSATRQIRVVREGDEMSVDALIGMPLDVEDEPVLSQRMILLMTRELIDTASGLTADEVRAEALRIAREQGRLRTRVGEDIYSRATGSMEAVVMHLGTSFDPAPGTAGAAARGEVGAGTSGAAGDPPAGASRYGVASIFDPSAGKDSVAGATGADDDDHDDHDPDDATLPAHDHDHGDSRGDPLDFGAGADISPLTLGRLGELPTGFGTLDELGHAHDGDPILSVNRALLAIHDAMWESERYLSLIEPGTAVPHQEEALERLQEMRENERVFPRGRVTVPPVDVADVRGTGEIDDASPAMRPHGQPRTDGRRWIGTLDDLLVRLNGHGSGDGDLAGAVHRFALELLSDPAVSPEISSRVVRASRGLQEGRPEESRQILLEVRRAMNPTATATGRLHAGTASVLSTSVRDETDDDVRGLEGDGSGSSSARFVFATLRYQSGNWDAAPLVPQNLIHSLAQYTDLPVAPEGVVVDLSSTDIFRFPVLYLTGHIPVRFSDAESRNLREYVERGGFVFMDDHNHDLDGAFHRTATAELARIFGEDALQPLPNDHELYRTFFHFDDGPPTTSHELSGWGDGLIHPELHAIEVDGRIGVLYSNKDYSSEWSYHAVNKRFLARDNTRFGVNLILYALTR